MPVKSKLPFILLVEDNMANVFLQKRIINKLDCADKITVARTGLEAYELVKKCAEEPPTLPDLILLDINLPAMNGWEFMELYNQLNIPADKRPIVLILTHSEYSNDRRKARQMLGIDGYYNKPLTVPLLESIFENHFPERFTDL